MLAHHFHSRHRTVIAHQLVCQLVGQPVTCAIVFIAFGRCLRIQGLQDCEQPAVLYYDAHAATSILERNVLTSSITRSPGSIVLCASITLTGEYRNVSVCSVVCNPFKYSCVPFRKPSSIRALSESLMSPSC